MKRSTNLLAQRVTWSLCSSRASCHCTGQTWLKIILLGPTNDLDDLFTNAKQWTDSLQTAFQYSELTTKEMMRQQHISTWCR